MMTTFDALNNFVNRHKLPDAVRRRFLTAVQYGVYFEDINPEDTSEAFFLQFLAPISLSSAKKICNNLPSDALHQLIKYCFQHYREGSYILLNALDPRHPIQDLISGLRSGCYDPNQPGDVNDLEIQFVKDSDVCYELFNELLSLMIDSAGSARNELEQRFRPRPTRDQFLKFTRLFGLRHGLPFAIYHCTQPETDLSEKLRFLVRLFRQPEKLPQMLTGDILQFFSFVYNIIIHCEALSNRPETYTEGLHMLTCAIATKGRKLAQLPCLPSILKAMATISSLDNLPLVVYDQSDAPLFYANARSIAKLSKAYSAPILHLSLEQTLALSKKLGIEPLLNTTCTGALGYGGARNAIFLLTPILRRAFDAGHRSSEQLLSLPSQELINSFQEHVLGGSGSGDTILMLDDDMEIPLSNLYCHCLFAKQASQRYSTSMGYLIGRATRFNLVFQPLSAFLQNPRLVTRSTQWTNQICSAAMSEYVTKPKICLNLPFGSEEAHQKNLKEHNPLLHPSFHLAGNRYPIGPFPTRPWMGMQSFLNWYLPYSLQIGMTLDLLDPTNAYGRCVFPWNAGELHQQFKNLRDFFVFASAPEKIEEMQTRFWRNVAEFRNDEKSPMVLRKNILELIHTNVEKELGCVEKPLSRAEAVSLKKIGDLYLFYQKDATMLWDHCERVLSDPNRKPHYDQPTVTEYPLTNGLCLLFNAVGNGEFNQLLSCCMRETNYA